MGRTSTRSRRLAGVALAAGLAFAACGSDDTITSPSAPVDGDVPSTAPVTTAPVTTAPVTTAPVTTVPAAGGWIGGEPEWSGGLGGAAEESDSVSASAEVAEADAMDAAVATRDESAPEFESEPVTGAPADSDIAGDIVAPPSNEPLRAGSVDDGASFGDFLDYVARVTESGFVARDADLSGRIVATVVDPDGLPVPGQAIEVRSVADPDGSVVVLRTTADGTIRLFPGLYGFDTAADVRFDVVGVEGADGVVASPGGEATLVAAPADVADVVPLDVLFLLDATGSMGDEIDRLKRTIDTVADRVGQLEPRPDVRFAMTLYRDEGDAFVSSTFDFTDDVAVFRSALDEVVADGGGDYPEALDEGLAEALAAPAWRDAASAVQLVFLVADAPPQVGRQVPTPYTDSIRTAMERGVKIFPIASSESDDVAELVFRQLAVTTGAPFVFLSYGAGGAATGGATDITSTDYEELALDELVVRLIAEELADLTGGDVVPTPPTTVAPPTTNPDGQ